MSASTVVTVSLMVCVAAASVCFACMAKGWYYAAAGMFAVFYIASGVAVAAQEVVFARDEQRKPRPPNG